MRAEPTPPAVRAGPQTIDIPTLPSHAMPFRGHLVRTDDPDAPGVVVLHEIFGLNADMRELCARLADEGFHALCPDLFWRQRPGIDRPAADVAGDGPDEMALRRGFDVDEGVNDVQLAIDLLARLDGAEGPPRRVGCLGFCLGGLLSYRVAACCRTDAAVAYYGAGIERHLDEIRSLGAPLLLHLAEHDEFVPASAQRRIADVLAADPRVQLHRHAGAHHGFARRHGPRWQPDAAATAEALTLAFLRTHLRAPAG